MIDCSGGILHKSSKWPVLYDKCMGKSMVVCNAKLKLVWFLKFCGSEYSATSTTCLYLLDKIIKWHDCFTKYLKDYDTHFGHLRPLGETPPVPLY